MPYYDVAKLVTVTKPNLIYEMPCGDGTLGTTAVRILHKSPAEPHRALSCSKIWLSYMSNLVAFWMHLHNCSCFQEHLRMLLQSLRAPYLAPGAGSIWNDMRAPVRSIGVSDRFVCGFRTDFHFADVPYPRINRDGKQTHTHKWIVYKNQKLTNIHCYSVILLNHSRPEFLWGIHSNHSLRSSIIIKITVFTTNIMENLKLI